MCTACWWHQHALSSQEKAAHVEAAEQQLQDVQAQARELKLDNAELRARLQLRSLVHPSKLEVRLLHLKSAKLLVPVLPCPPLHGGMATLLKSHPV